MPETAVAPPTTLTPPEPVDRKPTGPRLPTINWRKAAAEFLLIVVGVLVALSVDALRQSIGERQRADSYLVDLRSDMQQMLQIVDRCIAFDSQAYARTASMVDYLQSADRVPEATVRTWRTISWSQFVTVDGTIRALYETGDLRLMSRDVRHSLSAYLTDQRNAER